ncbi:MAG: hypothetical protein R3194_09560, partial [Limnobacter sp.]|nr:hypothetical protein [Limnobacter sp.]
MSNKDNAPKKVKRLSLEDLEKRLAPGPIWAGGMFPGKFDSKGFEKASGNAAFFKFSDDGENNFKGKGVEKGGPKANENASFFKFAKWGNGGDGNDGGGDTSPPSQYETTLDTRYDTSPPSQYETTLDTRYDTSPPSQYETTLDTRYDTSP